MNRFSNTFSPRKPAVDSLPVRALFTAERAPHITRAHRLTQGFYFSNSLLQMVFAEAGANAFMRYKNNGRYHKNTFGVKKNICRADKNTFGVKKNICRADKNTSGVKKNICRADKNTSGVKKNICGADKNTSGVKKNICRVDKNTSGVDFGAIFSSKTWCLCPKQ